MITGRRDTVAYYTDDFRKFFGCHSFVRYVTAQSGTAQRHITTAIGKGSKDTRISTGRHDTTRPVNQILEEPKREKNLIQFTCQSPATTNDFYEI